MHKILVIRLYFLLDTIHVSDCVLPITTQQPDVWYRYVRCTAYKLAPDDGLTESESCTVSNRK
jgi:hypothetical protein